MRRRNRNDSRFRLPIALMFTLALVGVGSTVAAPAADASRSVVYTTRYEGTYASSNCVSSEAWFAANGYDIYRSCYQVKVAGPPVWSFQYTR